MSEKPYNSPQLDEIRKKIDALDNSIHDALMERAHLVLKIGEEKRRNNIQVVQPAREARMIRRLLARHQGALPEMAVVRIWRELVSAVSLLQTGLSVSVCVPEGKHEYWDLARDYFGSCLPMHKSGSALSAVAAVREEKATFAVLPWPESEEEQPWWAFLGTGTQDAMQIIVRLPHGDDSAMPNPDKRALVISKSGFDESGEDNSFLMIECDSGVSRARLVDTAQKAGLEPLSLSSMRCTAGGPTRHLMEVKDYVGKEDKRRQAFETGIEDDLAKVICVGGYPVPPLYAKEIMPKGDDIPAAPSKQANS